MSTTVWIGPEAHRLLRAFASDRGATMSETLEQLLEEDRRRRVLERANAVYAALRAQPDVWAEIESERALWDSTLSDGLPDDADEHPEAADSRAPNG